MTYRPEFEDLRRFLEGNAAFDSEERRFLGQLITLLESNRFKAAIELLSANRNLFSSLKRLKPPVDVAKILRQKINNLISAFESEINELRYAIIKIVHPTSKSQHIIGERIDYLEAEVSRKSPVELERDRFKISWHLNGYGKDGKPLQTLIHEGIRGRSNDIINEEFTPKPASLSVSISDISSDLGEKLIAESIPVTIELMERDSFIEPKSRLAPPPAQGITRRPLPPLPLAIVPPRPAAANSALILKPINSTPDRPLPNNEIVIIGANHQVVHNPINIGKGQDERFINDIQLVDTEKYHPAYVNTPLVRLAQSGLEENDFVIIRNSTYVDLVVDDATINAYDAIRLFQSNFKIIINEYEFEARIRIIGSIYMILQETQFPVRLRLGTRRGIGAPGPSHFETLAKSSFRQAIERNSFDSSLLTPLFLDYTGGAGSAGVGARFKEFFSPDFADVILFTQDQRNGLIFPNPFVENPNARFIFQIQQIPGKPWGDLIYNIEPKKVVKIEDGLWEIPKERGVIEALSIGADDQLSNLYLLFANEPWFVESFQMARKSHGVIYQDVDKVRNAINSELGTNLSDRNIGEYGDVYVLCTRGFLFSYGIAHSDPAGNPNYHHFIVGGDFIQLQNVLQSFIDNPTNLRLFVLLVFGWRNEEAKEFNLGDLIGGSEPDLFKDMRKLITYSPEKGKIERLSTKVQVAIQSPANNFEAIAIRNYQKLLEGHDVTERLIYLRINEKSFDDFDEFENGSKRVPKIFFLEQVTLTSVAISVVVPFIGFIHGEANGFVFPNPSFGYGIIVNRLFSTLTADNYRLERRKVKPFPIKKQAGGLWVVESNSEVTEQTTPIVEALATDPKVIHAVFGVFDVNPGHYMNEIKFGIRTTWKISVENPYPPPGILPQGVDYGVPPELKQLCNPYDAPMYQANAIGMSLLDGQYYIKLIFRDNKIDTRPGVYTGYILIIPQSVSPKIVQVIKSQPQILIQLFKKVFPEYDRSDDTLRMDESNPGVFN